jgi:hypothetical protein
MEKEIPANGASVRVSGDGLNHGLGLGADIDPTHIHLSFMVVRHTVQMLLFSDRLGNKN